ncbi:MAG: hypothetical protein FWC26_02620 [Fibromonadales bacterium]|nr:hypothetical protein [Fibromonadales bacterium]
MKKIFLLLLLPTLLFAQGTWDGSTADTAWYTDNKTLDSYTITTAEQLAGLAVVVNGGNSFQGKTIKLGADIVLNDTSLKSGWENWNAYTTGLNLWTPIGNNTSSFKGNFDGNNKVIIGLYANNSALNSYQGLFGNTNGATINNLGLTYFYVKAGSDVNGNGNAGGITSEGGTIINSYAIGNVSGSGSTGGISGKDATIMNSYFIGNVSGSIYASVGGIAGSNNTVINSYAISDVSGPVSSTGGIFERRR